MIGIALIGGSFALHDYYLDRRYTDTEPLPSIYAWANDARDERIAVVGMFVNYPFNGKDLSNYVQYVGSSRTAGRVRSGHELCQPGAAR